MLISSHCENWIENQIENYVGIQKLPKIGPIYYQENIKWLVGLGNVVFILLVCSSVY